MKRLNSYFVNKLLEVIECMFCRNCGDKTEEGAKFCHNCGVEIGVSLPISKKEEQTTSSTQLGGLRETAEEYLARTDIKDAGEAEKYLNWIRALFWIVFLSIVVMRGLSESDSDLAVILFFPYIGVMIYFIYFCAKVLKAERLPKANALWCVVFAPFSWLYLYPLIADPLKIILGKKQPPIRLSDSEKAVERQKATEASKRFWRRFWMIIGIVISIFVVSLIVIYLLV